MSSGNIPFNVNVIESLNSLIGTNTQNSINGLYFYGTGTDDWTESYAVKSWPGYQDMFSFTKDTVTRYKCKQLKRFNLADVSGDNVLNGDISLSYQPINITETVPYTVIDDANRYIRFAFNEPGSGTNEADGFFDMDLRLWNGTYVTKTSFDLSSALVLDLSTATYVGDLCSNDISSGIPSKFDISGDVNMSLAFDLSGHSGNILSGVLSNGKFDANVLTGDLSGTITAGDFSNTVIQTELTLTLVGDISGDLSGGDISGSGTFDLSLVSLTGDLVHTTTLPGNFTYVTNANVAMDNSNVTNYEMHEVQLFKYRGHILDIQFGEDPNATVSGDLFSGFEYGKQYFGCGDLPASAAKTITVGTQTYDQSTNMIANMTLLFWAWGQQYISNPPDPSLNPVTDFSYQGILDYLRDNYDWKTGWSGSNYNFETIKRLTIPRTSSVRKYIKLDWVNPLTGHDIPWNQAFLTNTSSNTVGYPEDSDLWRTSTS